MNSVDQVMTELKRRASEKYRNVLLRHGAPESLLGVSIADLKTIAKRIKGNQALACALYDTGIPDAMYLAGIVADGSKLTKKQLESWARSATWQMLSGGTVPAVTCESPHARELALKWIDSKKESLATAGWNTYAGIVATRPDDDLGLDEIKQLLDRVVREIDDAPNYVRYSMNGFVISVGAYVKPLLKDAKAAAKAIGTVSVDMGDTDCKVPVATDYIRKIETAGRVGKKRKTMRC